ncbi:hypothetical protein L596_014095 [Steinernema carpocapsae]|uniref:Uncharacterized protein n=1 Tax=Steinernema carpocapsae TaxID=34508 RepID=A0A4U5NAJ5_STECR|nr:hypothetical protein L596_014095 [Steinernema carpocapsae]
MVGSTKDRLVPKKPPAAANSNRLPSTTQRHPLVSEMLKIKDNANRLEFLKPPFDDSVQSAFSRCNMEANKVKVLVKMWETLRDQSSLMDRRRPNNTEIGMKVIKKKKSVSGK